MIELTGNFNDDSFIYAERFITLTNQMEDHSLVFSKDFDRYLDLSRNIRTFDQLDKQFKERYFPEFQCFSFLPLEKNPSLRTVYYFPFQAITPINCDHIYLIFEQLVPNYNRI